MLHRDWDRWDLKLTKFYMKLSEIKMSNAMLPSKRYAKSPACYFKLYWSLPASFHIHGKCLFHDIFMLLHILMNKYDQHMYKWKRRSVGAPSRDVPSLSLFQTKSPSSSHFPCKVTPWRHVTSGGIDGLNCHVEMALQNLQRSPHSKVGTSHFSTWQPWPLTYDLDLRTWLRFYQGHSPYQITWP